MKKIFACILSCILIIGFASVGTTSASAASIAESAIDYEWGHEYSGADKSYINPSVYRIDIEEKSLLNIEVSEITSSSNDCSIAVLNEDGDTIINTQDFCKKKNASTGATNYVSNRIVEEGTYYFKYSPYSHASYYSIMMTREPALSLRKAKTDSVKSTSAGTLTVTASSKDSDLTGFQIQYATKPDFSDAKSIEAEDSTTKITGLVRGKKYYVRSRAFAIYGNGMYIYSAWSTVKSRTTKK